MKQHGLDVRSMQKVFKVTVVPKLLYASFAWAGFISASTWQKYEAFLRRAIRLGYYGHEVLTFSTLLDRADSRLFNKIMVNSNHVLHPMLPPPKVTPYSLRPVHHDRVLPIKDSKNFISRLLYTDIY